MTQLLVRHPRSSLVPELVSVLAAAPSKLDHHVRWTTTTFRKDNRITLNLSLTQDRLDHLAAQIATWPVELQIIREEQASEGVRQIASLSL